MERSLLLHTTAGHGFVAQLKDMVTRVKAGKEFMKSARGANVISRSSVCQVPGRPAD